MKNNKYWEERANLRMESYHKDSNKVIAKINKAYDKALEDINEDIDHIFNTYVSKHNLTPEEARELLNEAADPEIVIEKYKETLSKVQDDTIKNRILARLNKEAYKARITRLEALKESIRANMYKVADTELTASTKGYLDTIDSAYYHNMYDLQKGLSLGFDFAPLDDKGMQEILKQNWSGKHYSERVWGNTQVLSSKLEDIVTNGMLTGKSNRQMTNELMDMTNSGKLAAERLVRTETTYVANAAEMESYKEAEVDKYVFVATLDSRTSKVCREHDGKVYKVSEGVPGENMPPLHPFCRSTTIAYDGEETLARMQRRARDPVTGKTYTVPANMSYEEWRKQYVEGKYGKDKADALDKMVKNKASDRKQFERYKEILGKDAPKSLKDFQELKYNNGEGWIKLKEKFEPSFIKKDFKDIPSFHKNCSDLLTRKWYRAHDENIPNLIDKTKSIEEQARQAHALRNTYRTQARDLMRDQEKRRELDKDRPNLTFEEQIDKKIRNKGISRENAINDILKTATKTNKTVDKSLGLE